jgi:hypothetical protein
MNGAFFVRTALLLLATACVSPVARPDASGIETGAAPAASGSTPEEPRVFMIRGVVIEEATGTPLPHGYVELRNPRKRTVTDSLGRYEIGPVPLTTQRQDFTVSVMRLGYIREERQLWVRDMSVGICISCSWDNDTVFKLNFYMRPAPYELEF